MDRRRRGCSLLVEDFVACRRCIEHRVNATTGRGRRHANLPRQRIEWIRRGRLLRRGRRLPGTECLSGGLLDRLLEFIANLGEEFLEIGLRGEFHGGSKVWMGKIGEKNWGKFQEG